MDIYGYCKICNKISKVIRIDLMKENHTVFSLNCGHHRYTKFLKTYMIERIENEVEEEEEEEE